MVIGIARFQLRVLSLLQPLVGGWEGMGLMGVSVLKGR